MVGTSVQQTLADAVRVIGFSLAEYRAPPLQQPAAPSFPTPSSSVTWPQALEDMAETFGPGDRVNPHSRDVCDSVPPKYWIYVEMAKGS